MRYMGCPKAKPNLGSIIFDGVFLNKEFYQSDNLSPLISEPEYISTLFWNPSVLLNSETPIKISFKKLCSFAAASTQCAIDLG